MSQPSSPSKGESPGSPEGNAGWVKFDEADSSPVSASPSKTNNNNRNSYTGSSVSSARGSVTSATIPSDDPAGGGGVLPVSEIQVRIRKGFVIK